MLKLMFWFSFVAADNFRPYLTSFQGNTFTDYINAVFVDVSSKPSNHMLEVARRSAILKYTII